MAKEQVLEAIISGVVQWDNNRPFESRVKFTLIPPEDGERHYGTGCYLHMEVVGEKGTDRHFDVRYLRTTDIRKLAKIVAEEVYGDNMKQFKVVK